MTQLKFRTRLLLVLFLFAVVPALTLTLAWDRAVSSVLPLVGENVAWDSVAATGERAIAAARRSRLDARGRRAVEEHEEELRESLLQARRVRHLAPRLVSVIGGVALLGLLVLAFVASRVAGHLSRQLSRPLDELVEWTDLIARGSTPPAGPPRRGAPEFETLRGGMRRMAAEIERGRQQELAAERLEALRESARQVAHELKNPLTPIRFAVARLRRDAAPELAETVEVLATETERLDRMARSFASFGRLPEGPESEVDMGELARYTARSTVPEGGRIALSINVAEGVPMVRGQHDALARALSNVLINAVEACGAGGAITVDVRSADNGAGVEVVVRDTGCGIPPERLERIWEPYVTHKAGGTGLGLAIVRQTVLAHRGTVGASSAPGEGTEIRFVLPVSRTQSTTDSEDAA